MPAFGSFGTGLLLFSLRPKPEWRKLVDRPTEADDYEVYPKSDWNYALLLDKAQLANSVQVQEAPLCTAPFDGEKPPVSLRVEGVPVPSWTLVDNSAGTVPLSPVSVQDNSPTELTLIPYGSAKLRVTAFPFRYVEKSGK